MVHVGIESIRGAPGTQFPALSRLDEIPTGLSGWISALALVIVTGWFGASLDHQPGEAETVSEAVQ